MSFGAWTFRLSFKSLKHTKPGRVCDVYYWATYYVEFEEKNTETMIFLIIVALDSQNGNFDVTVGRPSKSGPDLLGW